MIKIKLYFIRYEYTADHEAKMFRSLSIVFFIFFILISTLSAQKPRLAVIPFENLSKNPDLEWLSVGIAATITNNVVKIPQYIAVERYQLHKVIDEQKLQLSGAIDENTAVSMGKIAGVNKMILGNYQVTGNNIRLSGRIVDVASGGIDKTAQATGTMKDIFILQDQIVAQLLFDENGGIEVRSEKTNLEAYEHFGKGVLMENENDHQGALRQFAKAVEADQAFSIAEARFKDAFWSLNPGNFWRYRSEARSEDGTLYYAGTEIRKAGSIREWNGEPAFSYISEADNKTSEQVYRKGKDGIEYLANNSSNSKIKFDPPALVFPYKLIVGESWSTRNQATIRIENNTPKTVMHTHSIHILRKEKVTIPAGIFDAYVVGYTQHTPEADFNSTIWFAPGAGMLRVITEMHMSFSGIPSTTTIKTELIDYKIY